MSDIASHNEATPNLPEMGLVPHKPVTVQVVFMTAKFYPVVKGGEPIHERAHAFQVNTSALKTLPIDTRHMLDMLGEHLS